MAEAEKYLGTQSTHTNQSTQPKTPPKKNYSLSILLFILGILAVTVLTVFTSMRKLPSIVLVSELIVLASLIGLLLVSISAKRRMVKQFAINERYPYANVEKKEIEAIFDKIAEEEKKRRKLDAFASGVDLSKMPTVAAPKAQPEESENAADGGETSADKPKETSASSEESDIIAVFPDEDEETGNGKEEASDKDASGESSGKDGEAAKDTEDVKKEKRPASKRPEGESEGEHPRKKRPQEDGRPHKRRQRPYDPYYEDYYYDSNGKRRRAAPVYYDEYGNPIRPRVVYDEYGNPIRRRPADPRRVPAGKRSRPDRAAPQKRPASHSNAAGAQRGKKKRRAPSGPVAPVEMTPIKQWSNYGDDYVPVAIVDEEEEAAPAPVPKKRRPANTREADAERKPYVPQYDDDIVAVLDYDDEDNDDYAPPQRTRANEEDNSSAKKRKSAPEKYVPDYSDEEPVIALPDYDDEDEAPPPRQQYQRKQAAASSADYDDDDDAEAEAEAVIVLPRDEGYEEYIENKQAAERKAERRAKGQTALTIRKLRHKKIRRKSRKYKIFRASVHTLTEYLNSFSVKAKR